MKDSLEYLQEHVEKLLGLIKDPHPGLFTWCQAYADEMKWIVQYWEGNPIGIDDME